MLFLAGLVLALGIADCRLLENRDPISTPHHHAAALSNRADGTVTATDCSHTDLDGATRCPHEGLRVEAILTRTDETGNASAVAADPLFDADSAPISRLRGPPQSSAVRTDSGAERLLRNCICRR
ncbi:hypothetical protein [Nocardia fluminea]|uniref:hypothetical protein n=1 Tax=Nocardia fluminea TaxID=134984 RepID=UPI00117ED230|nr:hypothetical protein [Nocardia fluminea]